MSPQQTAAFIAWAHDLTQCVGRLADVSFERRDLLAARMEDLGAAHGFQLNHQTFRFEPLGQGAGSAEQGAASSVSMPHAPSPTPSCPRSQHFGI